MSNLAHTMPYARIASSPDPFTGRLDEVPEFVCVSAALRRLLQQADITGNRLRLATLEGEAGSGKYHLAQTIHRRSALANQPIRRRDAREWLATDAETACLNGILYLDRVDLLPPTGQNLLLNLLKVLQTLETAPIAPHFVLLVSAQSPLRQLAAQGQFLPDLAFRLTAVRFAIPPLRLRREDISPLAQTLLDRICTRYQQRPVLMGPGTLARLLQHNWPGNVRELAAVLETALLEASNGTIRPDDLSLPTGLEASSPLQPAATSDTLNLDAVIQHHVQYVLDLNRGNKLRAARQLGISRSTLYRILANETILTH